MAEIQRLGLHQTTMMIGVIGILNKTQPHRYPHPVNITLVLSVRLTITLTHNNDDRCRRDG